MSDTSNHRSTTEDRISLIYLLGYVVCHGCRCQTVQRGPVNAMGVAGLPWVDGTGIAIGVPRLRDSIEASTRNRGKPGGRRETVDGSANDWRDRRIVGCASRSQVVQVRFNFRIGCAALAPIIMTLRQWLGKVYA